MTSNRLDSLNVEANRLFKTDRQLSGIPGEGTSIFLVRTMIM